ncbi:aminoglycoside phosphotransferase family protein [Saccharibacillus sp. O23]|uniref:aminoglycoside phosphotransferase family protein n=1 Tax=Saccharibacillus sp. O23 TaxID=2009338 RepID=UPI0015C68077|nr:aminoglycoside phosphotransferase family protein [Saccharibacillus sp. O23]
MASEHRTASGTSSEAKILETDRGRYVLRRLSGTAQARREYRISEALQGQDVCPEILRTRGGERWFEIEEICYNVQRFIEPAAGGAEVADHAELGSVAGKLHAGLRSETTDGQPDRFDLERKWQAFLSSGTKPILQDPLILRLEEQVQLCLSEREELTDRTCIHGDLGKWNLIFGSRGVRIIDFGEARLGDRHFDLAALLTSTTDALEDRAVQYLSAYIEGYSRYADGFDASALARHIRSWNVRGAVALLEHTGINERSARYAARMLEQSESWAQRLRF